MVMVEWCGPRCSSVVCGSGSMVDSDRLHLTPSPHSGTVACSDIIVGFISKWHYLPSTGHSDFNTWVYQSLTFLLSLSLIYTFTQSILYLAIFLWEALHTCTTNVIDVDFFQHSCTTLSIWPCHLSMLSSMHSSRDCYSTPLLHFHISYSISHVPQHVCVHCPHLCSFF